MIIDGKKIAEETLEALKQRPKPKWFFAAVLVGDDAASVSFIKQKEKVARALGIDFRLFTFPADTPQDVLRKEIVKLAGHKTCGGIVLQLPLPGDLDRHYLLNAIPREKDVDVLGERALGAFYTGRNPVFPPAVGVVQKIIENCKLKIENCRSVIIGRGLLVGRPVALWLAEEVAELTIFNNATQDLRGKLKDADVIVSGTGKVGLFSAEDVKDSALVIDFGCARGPDGKIHGDFDPSPLEIGNSSLDISYTPTPGGTGPILVAQLFENFFLLNAKKH